MANVFTATDELFDALDVVDKVAVSLSAVSALTPANLPITNAVSCASVVLLSGYFECFLKNVVAEFFNHLNLLKKPLSALPYEMKLKHFESGARALTWASKQDKKLKDTVHSQNLASRLASMSDPAKYEFVWEAFADTKSNPGPDAVRDILAGLQIQKSWMEINGLVTKHGQLQTFLTSFIEMRNVCAHTGQHTNPPTGANIADFTIKFRALAECIDLLMGVKLDEFRALPP